jgi:transcriptional regulator with XRE-family HTH domain
MDSPQKREGVGHRFGERLREARVAAGLTRRDVERATAGGACPTTDQTVANVEAGSEPGLGRALALAAAVGRELSDLL